ncbi:MAG: DUF86 domain-containing protein [Nitrospiraceae bacterium]
MSRDPATLLDVARAGRLVVDFCSGLDRRAFMRDVKTQSAVLHPLLVIGEAVKRFSEEFRNRHPEIPWTVVAGMRDKLIHEYDELDRDEVWSTAQRHVPSLLRFLEPLLPKQERS